MKVAQEIDVDNVTIIINPQNKLEAKIPPATAGAVEIEEIPNTSSLDSSIIRIDGKYYPMSKVGVIKGTEWLVFQLKDFVPATTPTPVTEPEQPPVTNKVWTANTICEQNQDNPVYDETFTGVRLGGDLPEGITTVQITKANGQIQSFIYSGTDYKYNIDPEDFSSFGGNPVKVTLVTAQGNVSKPVSDICRFMALPY